ncbi:MAG TPA: hypothetical protein VNT30_09150 [Stellaceae bacterium]|nr:hypothetical protein [Stellaceae bacterium]
MRSIAKRAIFLVALGFCGTALLGFPAHAGGPQQGAFARWKGDDKCVADAQKQFPDHDLVSQQHRDDAINRCLVSRGLAPRAPMAATE